MLGMAEFAGLPGGPRVAAEVGETLSQILWDMVLKSDQAQLLRCVSRKGVTSKSYRALPNDEVRGTLGHRKVVGHSLLDVVDILRRQHLVTEREGCLCFDRLLFSPLTLARAVAEAGARDDLLRYYSMRAIRRRYCLPLSPRVAYYFRLLSDTVNGFAETRRAAVKHQGREGTSVSLPKEIIRDCERAVCSKSGAGSDRRQDESNLLSASVVRLVGAFFEACRTTGFLGWSTCADHLQMDAHEIDSEYLVSALFGVPTDVAGLDELFGGHGPILAESQIPAEDEDPLDLHRDQLGARVVVIAGDIGSGKSTLGLQFAHAVASIGGLATVVPLEQSPSEALYMLQTLSGRSGQRDYCIGTDMASETHALRGHTGTDGAVLINAPGEIPSGVPRFDFFMKGLTAWTRLPPPQPVNLLVVDPLNALGGEENGRLTSEQGVRAATHHLIESAKKNHANLVLVVEDDAKAEGQFGLAQNVADVVVRMAVKQRHSYSMRTIEIGKSRLQREQRGEHSFSIVPGQGIHVYPSAPSVLARTRFRRPLQPHLNSSVSFGFAALDAVLGTDSLFAGDVVLLHGASGSFKTHLGLHFLLHEDQVDRRQTSTAERRSLLFTARDSEEAVNFLIQDIDLNLGTDADVLDPRVEDDSGAHPAQRQRSRRLSPKAIKICMLPKGYVVPGRVLHLIENEVSLARAQGYAVSRVMVDNVEGWSASSPLIQDDATFGVTLTQLLRGLRVTSVLTLSSAETEHEASLGSVLAHNADCCVSFEPFQYRGIRRVALRVSKSRGMKHRRELYEIRRDGRALALQPTSSLLRINPADGSVRPLATRLLVHVESEGQLRYYESLRNVFSAAFTGTTRLDFQDPLYMSNAMRMGRWSAVDELQILQFDEFQLSLHRSSALTGGFDLRRFHRGDWDAALWGDIDEQLLARCSSRRASSGPPDEFNAIPFFRNPSFLVYRGDYPKYLNGFQDDWEALAAACDEWKEEEPFFDFPKTSPENLNSLFFEILLARLPLSGVAAPGECPLRAWLASERAVAAGLALRKLSAGSHLRGLVVRTNPSRRQLMAPFRVSPRAKVWRHWYTTYNQMVEDLSKSGESHVLETLRVSMLPGGISTAGEWYLGIPAYSAAADAGLEMIKLMTTREAEANRLRLGIGLPVRSAFYRAHKDRVSTNLSRSDDRAFLHNCVDRAFRRSDIGCYHQVSSTVADHLLQLLERPAVATEARLVLQKLLDSIDYIQGDRTSSGVMGAVCERCRSLLCRTNTDPPSQQQEEDANASAQVECAHPLR
jgi:KaiC/GvpD/RAD55 family RecA-like ATPase